MTININSHPNHLHLGGDVTVGARFGGLINCRPVNLAGAGHCPHIEARFAWGLRIELDRATASEFARALTESVNALPVVEINGADLSGSVADLGGDVG